MSDSDFTMVLPFDTDEPEFCRGVEVGMVYSALKAEPYSTLTFDMHGTNAEMVLRLGESMGRTVKVLHESEDGYWMHVEFGQTP